MSRVFEGMIDQLSKETGYGYDYLVDRYNEVMEDGGNVQFFIDVTVERDW